jgi:alpha-L-fucosidase
LRLPKHWTQTLAGRTVNRSASRRDFTCNETEEQLMHKSIWRGGRTAALFTLTTLQALPLAAQDGPAATPELAAEAAAAAPAIPPGPFQPTWASLRENYRPPGWFQDGRFGIFIHWGLYAVPGHGNEWYVLHMYGNQEYATWHTEHFGPPAKFGYKDFIPMFTAAKFNPEEWAALFKKAGARYVMLTAEHHDGFALWDSALTKFDAMKMGPHRDLVGGLARSVRAAGLKFGLSNHRMEHFTFIRVLPGLETDLFDPAWADFYSVADRSPAACRRFLTDWVARNDELVDKYRPDLLYFDNGVNGRNLDAVKLRVAAYYYNRAREWGQEVSISTKDAAYLAGSILDFERGRSPDLRADVWQEDTSIAHNSWGFNYELKYRNAGEMVRELVDCVSKNGNYLLNIAPQADGTIPEGQQLRLLEIGEWLRVNGEAIYGSRPWTVWGEGPTKTEPRAGRGLVDGMLKVYTAHDIRFTTKNGALYAILFAWPADNQVIITALASGQVPEGKIQKVTLLGGDGELAFTQDAGGLKVKLPALKPCDYAYVLKILGLKVGLSAAADPPAN